MFIGLDYIGITPFDNHASYSPNFYSVDLKSCIVDEIYISNRGDILDSSKQNWGLDTYLLARFLGNLEAGNVGLGGLEITNWRIRRREIDGINYKLLATIPETETENFQYLDYTPRSTITYEYDVTPLAGDIEGVPISVQITFKFDYWWITDGTETYPLYLNLEVSDINTNQQRHIYEGFDEFPTISYGDMEYDSGTITAIILDEHLRESPNYRERFKQFIINKKPKILRNPVGDVWIVDTFLPKRKILTELEQSPSYFTFEWMQIGKDE